MSKKRKSFSSYEQPKKRLVIPGYYYDEEKKRYFKIDKFNETCRQYFSSSTSKHKSTNNTSIINSFHLLRMRENNFVKKKYFMKYLYQNLSKEKNFSQFSWIPANLLCKATNDYIICAKNNELFLVKDEKVKNIIYLPSQISSIRFSNESTPFLLSTHLGCESLNGELYMCNPFNNYKRNLFTRFKGSCWTCELYKNFVSIGSTRSSFIYDLNREKVIRKIFCGNSDVFSQQYENFLLYNGTRDGNIYLYDTRQKKSQKMNIQNSSIISMKLLSNGIHLILSTMNGTICMIDCRKQTKILNRYNGHVNECTFFEISIDLNEEYLFSGGSDNKLRIWDIQSSELIKQLNSENTRCILINKDKIYTSEEEILSRYKLY